MIILRPTDNLQSLLDAGSPYDLVRFTEGVYQIPQGLRPKNGMKFLGSSGVTLAGGDKADCAFEGNAAVGVEIHGDGMIVEHFASPQQCGAIGNGFNASESWMQDWLVEKVEARLNLWRGISLGNGARAIGCNVHHNGDLGIGGIGRDILIQDNEIAFNNTANNSPGWEAGGAKFSKCERLRVIGNWVHNNSGPGVWDDIGCFDVIYEGNRVWNNLAGGISHEIGYRCKIRNNDCRYNTGASGPWWGSQILVAASRDTEVYGNRLVIGVWGSNGIQIVNQLRQDDSGATTYNCVGVFAHHNDVTHTKSPAGCSGLLSDMQDSAAVNRFLTEWGNRFDFNQYHVTDLNAAHWAIGGPNPFRNWVQWVTAGMDKNGMVDSTVPEALA